MKKYVIIAIAFFIVAVSIILAIAMNPKNKYASKISGEVTSAIYEEFGESDFDAIVEIYHISAHPYFSDDNASIDELTRGGTKAVFYLLLEDNQTSYVRMAEDGIERIENSEPYCEYWDDFVRYALNPDLVFAAKYKVEAVYCLHGLWGEGMFIYYKTDKGDFLLQRDYGDDRKTYLFPYDEFCNLSKEVVSNFPPSVIQEGYSRPSYIDISEFEFKENTISDVINAILCALCFGTVSALIFMYVKKVKSN